MFIEENLVLNTKIADDAKTPVFGIIRPASDKPMMPWVCMAKNGPRAANPTPAYNSPHRINFVTSRTFVCRKRRGEPAGLVFRGMPPNTPAENVMPWRYCLGGIWMV